jgi:hypothetical protein
MLILHTQTAAESVAAAAKGLSMQDRESHAVYTPLGGSFDICAHRDRTTAVPMSCDFNRDRQTAVVCNTNIILSSQVAEATGGNTSSDGWLMHHKP